MRACVRVKRDRRRSKEAEGTPWKLVVAMRELKMWLLIWTRRPASWQTQWPKEELTIHPGSIENRKREEEKKQGHCERRRRHCVKLMEHENKECVQNSLALATNHGNDPINRQFDDRGHDGVIGFDERRREEG